MDSPRGTRRTPPTHLEPEPGSAGQAHDGPPERAAPDTPAEVALSARRAPRGPWSRVLTLYPVLADPVFRLFWAGMLPTTISWQVSMVAAPYAAFTLDGRATVLGVVSLAGGLPTLALALVGGVAADRLPRRQLLIAMQVILGLAAAEVAICALAGWLSVWQLLVFSVLQGIAFSFNMPARVAYLGELTPRPLISNAIALNNAGFNFCRVAAPALAGAMLAEQAIGIGGVFLLMICLHVLVIGTLLRLPVDPSGRGARHDPDRPRPPSGWAQLLEGLTYIRASPSLVALLGTAMFVLVFGWPYVALLPLFAERVFDVGAAGLGILMAATGVGALIGTLAVAAIPATIPAERVQLVCGVGFGLFLIGFGLAPSFPIAAVFLALVGGLSAAYFTINSSLIMTHTEPRLYGRVQSVSLATFSSVPIGTMPAAWLADQVGGQITMVVCGALVVTSVACMGLLRRPRR